jgi:hypothetical protein
MYHNIKNAVSDFGKQTTVYLYFSVAAARNLVNAQRLKFRTNNPEIISFNQRYVGIFCN